jgi:hypothetical protein
LYVAATVDEDQGLEKVKNVDEGLENVKNVDEGFQNLIGGSCYVRNPRRQV